MDERQAKQVKVGTTVTFRGREARVNAISMRGVHSPHFTLTYLDTGEGEGWTSHMLCGLAWTFEGYWNVVIGPKPVSKVIAEFDLDTSDRRGLSEWLGEAESAAWAAGPRPTESFPIGWEDFHERALEMLIGGGS